MLEPSAPRPGGTAPPETQPVRARPNVIVIVADDLGYGDLSCLGSDFATPNLDALAAGGIRFTDWHCSSPVCSPSRASILTGLYPHRTNVVDVLSSERGAVRGMTPGIPTLADALRAKGYRTGMVGKWHLGTSKESWPDRHGFDTWFGFLAGCVDYYSHLYYYDSSPNPVHDLWDDGREVYLNGRYLTELFTEKATSLIRSWHSSSPEPFFLYLAYNAPHYPMHVPSKYIDRFRHLPAKRRIMAAMISALDDGVGEVVNEVERCGITQDTMICFMSDNGPSPESRNWMDGRLEPYDGWSTAGLKGHKYLLFEGGTRVPAIMAWPAQFPAGQVLDRPLIAMDLYPTVLHAAQGQASAQGAEDGMPVDGVDILHYLCGAEQGPKRSLFWSFRGQTAVREGQWKLVISEKDDPWLSNLREDVNETVNWAREHPGIVEELQASLKAWIASSDEGG